ncbi:hypothetical protein ACOBQX_23400 [Actinokineospora sp. G85]|uniref:hypothetical protein n=1 Tax=Actinokineospora sp. G85 TaxID=3406626 RepID=UPI003C70D525
MDRQGTVGVWAVRRLLVVGMVVAVVVSALMLMAGTGAFRDAGVPVAPESADGLAQPALPTATHVDPFDRTPASGWAEGAAGIVAPAAAAVGEFSAAQVSAATSLVRDALVASRVDPALVTGHNPAGYLRLLAPDAAAQLRPLFGTGREPEAQALVSMADSASPLLPVPPRVTGSMRVEPGDPGELVVHTNYLFAYAFDSPPEVAPAPMDAVVLVRADVDYVLRVGAEWTPSSQGLWYGDVGGYGYAIACHAYRRGFLAPAYLDQADPLRGPPHTDPGAYFDPSAPLPQETACR